METASQAVIRVAAGEALVRDARPEEIAEVARLIRASYEEYEPFYAPERWRGYIDNVGNLGARDAAEYDLLVAELDGRLAGAVLFYPDGSKSGQGEWPAGWAGVLRLAVLPAERGHGLGRALVEECLRRARALGLKTIGLHSTEWMAVARGMYERMGFVRVEEFDFRPRPGVVGMGFRLDLAPLSSSPRRPRGMPAGRVERRPSPAAAAPGVTGAGPGPAELLRKARFAAGGEGQG